MQRFFTDVELSIGDGVVGSGGGPPGRAARRELAWDDQDQREDEGDGKQDAAAVMAVEVWSASAVAGFRRACTAGGGEGDKDAEPASAAQLVCGVDEAGSPHRLPAR